MRNILFGVVAFVVCGTSLAVAPSETDRLYDAVADGQIEIVRDFLHAGGSPNVIVTRPKTRPWPRRATQRRYAAPIVEVAILAGHDDIATLLVEAGADHSSIHIGNVPAVNVAAEKGMYKLLSLLLERDPTLLAEGSPDNTPLIQASYDGRFGMVSLMLNVGTQASIHWGSRLTIALRHALNNGHEDIARLLLEAGADPSEVLVFHAAVAGSNVGMVHDLIEAGASPSALFEGKSPFRVLIYRLENNPSSEQPALILAELVDAGLDACAYLEGVVDPAEDVVELFRRVAHCKLSLAE